MPLMVSMVCVDLEHSHLHGVKVQTLIKICINYKLRNEIADAPKDRKVKAKHWSGLRCVSLKPLVRGHKTTAQSAVTVIVLKTY